MNFQFSIFKLVVMFENLVIGNWKLGIFVKERAFTLDKICGFVIMLMVIKMVIISILSGIGHASLGYGTALYAYALIAPDTAFTGAALMGLALIIVGGVMCGCAQK